MKTPHSQQGTPVKAAGDKTKALPAAGTPPPLILTCDHRAAPFEHWPRPTELQLAELAARLVRTEKVDPRQLVAEAWGLYWESCKMIQQDHLEVQKILQTVETQDDERWIEEQSAPPQPKKFPVTFRQVELLLLPRMKGRTGDRASVFREYAFAQLLSGSFTCRGAFRVLDYWDFQPEALQELRERLSETIAEKFGVWRKSVYDAPAYARFANSFLKWYGQWSRRRNSETKSANARKGWAKRRARKRAKTGAKPKHKALEEALRARLQETPNQGLDGTSAPKKA